MEAIPGLGVGLRLIFSAWSAAVAGTGPDTVAGRDFSRETINLSMVPFSFSSFWLSWDAQSGSAVEDKDDPASPGLRRAPVPVVA